MTGEAGDTGETREEEPDEIYGERLCGALVILRSHLYSAGQVTSNGLVQLDLFNPDDFYSPNPELLEAREIVEEHFLSQIYSATREVGELLGTNILFHPTLVLGNLDIQVTKSPVGTYVDYIIHEPVVGQL